MGGVGGTPGAWPEEAGGSRLSPGRGSDLRLRRGAGPGGGSGGRSGVTCRRCASVEGSASCAAGSGAPTPPRRPAPAPPRPRSLAPGRPRPSRQRPRRFLPPSSRALLPLRSWAVGAVHGERIMAIEGKWRPSDARTRRPAGERRAREAQARVVGPDLRGKRRMRATGLGGSPRALA